METHPTFDSIQPRRRAAAPLTVAFAALSLATWQPAVAEAPLSVEGAETESRGSYEISAEVAFDDDVRGIGFGIGYVPWRNIEVELEGFRGRDRGSDPGGNTGEGELSIKWVPEQSGLGLSYGVMLSIERGFADDDGEREFETEQGIMGVFSYDIPDGPLVHFNLGLVNEREDGEHETVTAYGLGFETRISRRWTLAAEITGKANEQADKMIGLRYKMGGDSSFFIRVGRGQDRTYGGIGFALEIERE